jgi:Peptidase family C25
VVYTLASIIRGEFRPLSMSYCLVAAILFASNFAAAASSNQTPRITVLQSTNSEFRCRAVIDESAMRTIGEDSKGNMFVTFQIAVPSNAGGRIVSAIPVESKELSAGRRGHSAGSLAGELVTIGEPYLLRGIRIATVTISPATGHDFVSTLDIAVQFVDVAQIGAPVSDPLFDAILSTSIMNYDVARNWRRDEPKRVNALAADPLESTSTWYKIHVNQTGMTKVTGAQLVSAGLLLGGIPSSDVRLFNYGGKALEPLNDSARPVFTEVAIQVFDGDDGLFDAADYIVFYGESLDRFLYSTTKPARFINHPYAAQNIYWLATDGTFGSPAVRMASVDGTPSGAQDTTVNAYRRWVHVEQNHLVRAFKAGNVTDYLTWFWSNNDSLTFSIPTPSVVGGSNAFLYFGGKTFDTTGSFDQRGFIDATINGAAGLDKLCNDSLCTYRTTALVNGLNTIRLALGGASFISPYFDYANVNYLSTLTPANGRFEYISTGYTGAARVEIVDNFTATPLLFDISNMRSPTVVSGATRSGGKVSVDMTHNASVVSRLIAVQPDVFFAPSAIEKSIPAPLRGVPSQTDALVIAPTGLVDDMAEWVAYREGQGHTVTVTAIEDIMDVYGWGVYDPAAIRDYVKYVYESAPTPSPAILLMVGDASFDYRNYAGTGIANYAPTYIHRYDESASDDNYVYFGSYGILDSDTSGGYLSDRGYDMMVARWPVQTAGEIAEITAKIKAYESPSNFGSWRSRVTLVADDEFGTYDFEGFHTTQTEDLERQFLPRVFNREKIYLWDYPFETGKRKPKVNEAIVKSLNEGTLLVNYVGHGNPDVWAGEHVFTRNGDVPRLRTENNLPLVFAASCDIGFFDDPIHQAMAEDLLVQPDGAIAVISATRIVFSSDNAAFNQECFDVMFSNDSLTACAAMYSAKIRRQYNSGSPPDPRINDRKYMFFGDPFLRLGIPQMGMEFTQRPDSLSALSLVTVAGRISDDANATVVEDGVADVTVYDSERNRLHYVAGNDTWIPYVMNGSVIYRGSATVTNGQFSVSFMTPLDIGFGGQAARVSLYGKLETTDASGVVDSIPVSSQVASSTDSAGPTIAYNFAAQPEFVSGGTIRNGDVLNLIINDPSGINLVSGMGHSITMQIDDDQQSIADLTPLFSYSRDSHTSGSLSYTMTNLTPGSHYFKILAWDNANNSSAVEFTADVLGEGTLAIADLLNYPNPMQSATSFSFVLTQEAQSLTLELFTLSGRKIQQFRMNGPLTARRYDNAFSWDGRDQYARDRVATGVYIYKATAVGASGGESAESFGKVVVIN